ncbi:MAG: hypothetical protein ABEI98_03645 [Halorhabdus sp.]
MGLPVPCQDCGETVEVSDDDEDAPHVKVQSVFIEDGERHVADAEKVYLCDDCRPEGYGRAVAAAEGD